MSTLRDLLEAGLHATPDSDHPRYPGAVALVMRDGEIIEQVAVGEAVRYHVVGGQIEVAPEPDRVPMRPDTVFDIASVTKLFTAVTALALAEEGLFGLDAPVAGAIPEWAHDQRGQITPRQLLTHTAGLPATQQLWALPTQARRIAAVFETPLTRMPGMSFEYSCLGYIALGLFLERQTGSRLARLVHDAVVTPLHLTDTTYLPGRALVERCAATEYQPYAGRGMVRGEVHDETSWSLGGTAGNAGVFSTAADLARFGEMLRRGGELDGARVLSTESADLVTTNQLPAGVDPGYRHGLGPRIGDHSFMGELAAHGAFGHTGFTGTSLVVTPRLRTVTVLLTNRVHPSREWSEISPVRRQVADFTSSL